MSKNILKISDENSFEKEVKNYKGLVLVDFWAEWCAPCRQLSPVLDKIADDMSEKIKVVKVNIDDCVEIASEMGIRSIPTLMVFKDGTKVDTKMGFMTESVIKGWIDDVL